MKMDFGSWPKRDKIWKDKVDKNDKVKYIKIYIEFDQRKMIKMAKGLVKIHHPSTLGDTPRLILCLDFWLSSKVLGFKWCLRWSKWWLFWLDMWYTKVLRFKMDFWVQNEFLGHM